MAIQLSLGIDYQFEVDPLWCAWFSGLVDGEASFLIGRGSKNSGGENIFRPRIHIKLREDDEPLLRSVQSNLRCGNVYHISYSKERERGSLAQDQVTWVCYKTQDLIGIVVPILDRFQLKSKKRNDYDLWRRAVQLQSDSAGRYNPTMLLRLKDEMESNRRGKFSKGCTE